MAGRRGEGSAPLDFTIYPEHLAADGFSTAVLRARAKSKFVVVEGGRSASIEGNRLRAGVLPGRVVVEARAPGFAAARAGVEIQPSISDSFRDGTPDFLRLSDVADRRAFVSWFTFLAETQAFGKPRDEVTDCAALARFAYREALREHDGRWAAGLELSGVPALPPVRAYQYPFTPLGPQLFRVAAGAFAASDVAGGAFAEFADAETLMRRNAHFVTRDIRRVEPGDLLFYRQLGQRMPFHMMIYVGPSTVEPPGEPVIVYHTGPTGDGPGEIRRPSAGELLAHPSPQWRPLPPNSNFLGVYRWNILRD